MENNTPQYWRYLISIMKYTRKYKKDRINKAKEKEKDN